MTDQPAENSDRVFVANYVRALEIGAYPVEHGVTQRLRFDIVLDVARIEGDLGDEVGSVINYDLLVSSIEALADGPRMNLLETFAERLAERVLANPLALKVRVRIAKLDRLMAGAELGCEITRGHPQTR